MLFDLSTISERASEKCCFFRVLKKYRFLGYEKDFFLEALPCGNFYKGIIE